MKLKSKVKNHKGKDVPIISSFTQSQREVMMNMYLSSVVCKSESIEVFSIMDVIYKYLNTKDVLVNSINPIIHNTELDKVDTAVDLMHEISRLVNDEELLNRLHDLRVEAYRVKDPIVDKTTRVKGTKLYVSKMNRAILFSFNIDAWRIDISYKIRIGLSDDDITELYDKYDIDNYESVPFKELSKYEFKVEPIDKFLVSVRECNQENSSKQIHVTKNINIENRVIVTYY